MSSSALNLLDIDFPVFEEATQTAARFLGMPICTVGIPHGNTLALKAAIGLSQLGLMNPLARTRRLPLEDTLTHTILQTQQRLVLPQIDQDPFTQSCLVQEYGIQAYLGVPLLTAEGHCIGILAAMDTQPQSFSEEAIAFMELLARWSVSEYERYQLSQQVLATETLPSSSPETAPVDSASLLDTVRLTLMSQLTQDMRNPLTTITGMADMLSREIYGPLTPKQREYATIVRSSSQGLLNIAHEVLELSSLNNALQPLQPTSVDFEMLGQQVVQSLMPLATKNHQDIQLTVEPGSRLWTLDRDVVRQLLYYLTLSVISLAKESGIIRIHGSERDQCLTIGIWVAHPWLGEGLPSVLLALYERLRNPTEEAQVLVSLLSQVTGQVHSSRSNSTAEAPPDREGSELPLRETLSFCLGRHLIHRHQGTLTLQGSQESGHRLLVVLPPLGTVA